MIFYTSEFSVFSAGIGWHVHTTADASDLDPTSMIGSPRSVVFASKYPVIGAIGSQSFDAEEDSEEGEFVQPHPRSQLDMATPSLPLREHFDYDDDPTPRNRDLDDHRLFAAEGTRKESQLAPVPEPSDVLDIDGPLFDEVVCWLALDIRSFDRLVVTYEKKCYP